MRPWPRLLALAAGAAGMALVGGVLASNFIGGEKKIERHIERLYALDDPRFMDELGVLLGPPFLAGTRVQALLNGKQIFPPMLAAILKAMQRGVKLRIIVPGKHIDSDTVRSASRSTWGRLVKVPGGTALAIALGQVLQ